MWLILFFCTERNTKIIYIQTIDWCIFYSRRKELRMLWWCRGGAVTPVPIYLAYFFHFAPFSLHRREYLNIFSPWSVHSQVFSFQNNADSWQDLCTHIYIELDSINHTFITQYVFTFFTFHKLIATKISLEIEIHFSIIF